MYSRTAAQGSTATAVRSGATLLTSIKARQHAGAAARLFLQIFNTNAPTVGTTAPEVVIPVPAGDANVEAMVLALHPTSQKGGIYLSTGLAYAVTTTHDGLTGPTAGQEPEIELQYEAVG